MTDELLLELLREVRGLRRDLSRRRTEIPDDMVRALENRYGCGSFTVAGIMSIVEADPYDPLTAAVELAVDLNAGSQSRSTKLGQVLAGLADLELVDTRRGAAVYRVRQGRKGRGFD